MTGAARSHPYRDLPAFCFWSKAMSSPAPGQIDPMVYDGPRISPESSVSTMGSCFAQHISRHIQAQGYRYLVTEQAPPGLPPAQARQFGYGVFTARYGNVYTVRQAVQLFDRAFGQFSPHDDVWECDGGYVDAFRPQIEPTPFAHAAETREAAASHLGCVRDMFETTDWLVFTLGLTEAWRSTRDGAVYPVAPGVTAGAFDADRYEFVNFSIDEVRADLTSFVTKLAAVNPRVRVILTVSPVPLIATHGARHVLTATTYSKSVLRVAAEEVSRAFAHVVYFPSFEIITSPAAGGRYFEDDLRQVTELGVRHVMRVFATHFLDEIREADETPFEAANASAAAGGARSDDWNVVCDEEVVERALQASGFPHKSE